MRNDFYQLGNQQITIQGQILCIKFMIWAHCIVFIIPTTQMLTCKSRQNAPPHISEWEWVAELATLVYTRLPTNETCKIEVFLVKMPTVTGW